MESSKLLVDMSLLNVEFKVRLFEELLREFESYLSKGEFCS